MSLQTLDLHILLDFLQPSDEEGADTSKQSIAAQRASLETISSICSNVEAVNCLRDLGGINLIWNLCCNTESLVITHSCLFALACIAQNNVFAQQDLCLRHVFESLKDLLSSSDVSLKTKSLATYFLLTLVSKNKQGQTEISNSECLDSLMNLFVYCSRSLSGTYSDYREKLQLFKVLTKTLSYAANVPQNVENQNRLSEILPWIVNGVHSGQKSLEISRHSCDLLTVVVEDNKKCQLKAMQCRAVEALILLINHLLRKNDDDECLGSATVALNQMMIEDCQEQWRKFECFGGCLVVQKLIALEPSEKWIVFHINQTLMLLSKCIENCNKTMFDRNFCSVVSKSVIKLMKSVSEDEYFHKMAVHILDFILQVKPEEEEPLSSKNSSILAPRSENLSKTALFSPVSSKTRADKLWSRAEGIWGASAEKCITPISTSKISSALHHRAYTTILVRKKDNGKPEIMLDISKSSKEALKASSGIQCSPTENIFPYQPGNDAAEEDIVVVDSPEPVFKKPRPADEYRVTQRFTKPIAKLPCNKIRRNSSVQNLNISLSAIRYSTPKSKKLNHKKLFYEASLIKNTPPSDDKDDVVSLCGNLIEREALNSVRRNHSLKRFGSSGVLIGQNYKCF